MQEVRALEDGFYGGAYRRKGDTFAVPKGEKSNWFVPVDVTDHSAPASEKRASKKADSDE